MNRIANCFSKLKQQNRGAFIPYVESGDPDYQTALEILKQMPSAGADLIEIGMPFSDAMADGPIVQQAANRALKAGATMKNIFRMVSEFRTENTHTPIILMGYANPIEHYGYENFCQKAAKTGVDGLIVVDIPYEEMDNIRPYAKQNQIDLIQLVTPNTPQKRLERILKEASGFIYYVSITGVTGTKTASHDELTKIIPTIRSISSLPIVVGFGIKTPEAVTNAVTVADGAVVASALLSTLASSLDKNNQATPHTVKKVIEHTSFLANAAHLML